MKPLFAVLRSYYPRTESQAQLAIEAVRADPVLQRVYFGAEPAGFAVGTLGEVAKTALNWLW
jgi:hypothetical protein